MANKFAVIEFTSESTVEVVSTQWLDKSKLFCHWPSCSTPSLKKLILAHCKPGSDWKTFNCRVLRIYDDYAKARKGLIRAEKTDNLQTSGLEEADSFQTKRKKNRNVSHKLVLQKKPKLLPLRDDSSSDSSTSLELFPELTLPKTALTHPQDNILTFNEDDILQGDVINIEPEHFVFDIPDLNTPVHSAGATQQSNTDILNRINSMQVEHRKFQETVVNHLLSIKNDVKEVLRRTAETQQEVNTTMHKLPVDTVQELGELNLWLGSDENAQKLKRELSYIGGSTASSITQRILARLIGSKLATKLSLTGKGKLAESGIKDSLLHLAIYESVRKTKGGGAAVNSEIDTAIKLWLKNATDRCGGRERRRQKKEQEKNSATFNDATDQSCSSRQLEPENAVNEPK